MGTQAVGAAGVVGPVEFIGIIWRFVLSKGIMILYISTFRYCSPTNERFVMCRPFDLFSSSSVPDGIRNYTGLYSSRWRLRFRGHSLYNQQSTRLQFQRHLHLESQSLGLGNTPPPEGA